MSKHSVQVVVEGSLMALFVFLEGKKFKLNRNGDTFQGVKSMNVEDTLDLIFHAFGVPPTKWKISITLDEASKPLFEHEGRIGAHNQSVLQQAIELPAGEAASKSSKAGKGGQK
jgi:hypothetical protein